MDQANMEALMRHSRSANTGKAVRFICNPCFSLKEPMNLNRDRPADFSLLERGTLRSLGLEWLDFKPAAPREAQWTPM